MTYKVIDPNDNIIDIEDDDLVPEGCRLMVTPMLLDSVQLTVFRDSNPDDHRTTTADAEQRRADAYASFKQSINTAHNWRPSPSGNMSAFDDATKNSWKRKPTRKPSNAGPWTSPSPSRSLSRSRVQPQWATQTGDAPATGSSHANLRKAFADKAQAAYEERNEYLRNAWRQKG